MSGPLNQKFKDYTEQDTVDKLILPWLASQHRFPSVSSLDYQAQHTLPNADGGTGRYDGLYLSGGYPYVVMEGKRYRHDLTDDDVAQARSYATSDFFDRPVPFLVVSNGREHRFLQISTTMDPSDGRPIYNEIPAVEWKQVIAEVPGEVRQMLTEADLFKLLKSFKTAIANDIGVLFRHPTKLEFDLAQHSFGVHLERIIQARRTFLGETAKGSSEGARTQEAIRQAIEGVALHFTIKVLFIKLIEDLARGGNSQRIIHTLFPHSEYDQIGGLFGYKVLNGLDAEDAAMALKVFARSKAFYRKLGMDIANVSWADIFRYGFSVNMSRYGQLFQARDYDRFMPSEATLEAIHEKLIAIDIRTAIIYGSASKRSNVIGDLYEKLIGDEIRSELGAVYTPDVTMRFMVQLGKLALGKFRGHKIVEPACGSGHFFREIYRRYVDEVMEERKAASLIEDPQLAHAEALAHVYGRDIDPFAVQLTLLSTFLEHLKDNVSPGSEDFGRKVWRADLSIDTQNSLDPITVDPNVGFDIHKTSDLASAKNLKESAQRAIDPDLIIGNPPYGVKVLKGAGYDAIYDLQSKDSYGYFIANALARLPEGKRVIFIVSSSFLTIGSHRKLRETILSRSKIIRVIKLHRATFPGIDTFPVILELERCEDAKAREQNYYQFYDFWRFHPTTDASELTRAYDAILADPDANNTWPFKDDIAKRYKVRQGVIPFYRNKPIFEGRPSLYEYMVDMTSNPVTLNLPYGKNQTLSVRAQMIRGRTVARLGKIASVKIGLQSGKNTRFYRVAPGASGGAAAGGYQDVDMGRVVKDKALAALTDAERTQGIRVNDPTADRYWVPLDKSGKADIENGLLAEYWRPIEFYVDWSEQAVSDMKALKGSVFRNSQHYFSKGISFSNTGIYSPTYRLSHGGVFDQKGSVILCEALDRRVLLGILSSSLLRYFAKSFINHGVDSQIDDLPIVIPDASEAKKISDLVDEIVTEQQNDSAYDYRSKADKIDAVVFQLYDIDADERAEIESWLRRHYPKLHP
ncbi:Eco57I restriction-modification methylase domain-containing protein [Qipengyuania spongiae]|uniref:site-specific DNA-methyltransferase (adenine-specific) n=1 Tax=Qipengyuania spongiae TaxID=2909673 RepID=A0ABY5SZ41_9SPHN|nr:N-6 DNA methylase [Qipengyuania spongiae]UVI38388.1 N-6 DNA methylase [Qipengyuania spongiae]